MPSFVDLSGAANTAADTTAVNTTTRPGMSSSSPPQAPGSRSSATATKRLLKEIQQTEEQPNPILLQFGPVSDAELTHWEAVMKGVPGTAYEDGLWKLDIQVPDKYPNAPPAVRFVTPICHPNVDIKTGAICLDLFNTAWSPSFTLSAVMDQVHHLLAYPNPDSPYNVDVANLLRDGDLVGAESLIRYCTGEWRWRGGR